MIAQTILSWYPCTGLLAYCVTLFGKIDSNNNNNNDNNQIGWDKFHRTNHNQLC